MGLDAVVSGSERLPELPEWPSIHETSVPQRYERLTTMPVRTQVQADARSWHFEMLKGEYVPRKYTAPSVRANAKDKVGDGISQGWADPETITPEVQARIEKLCALYHGDESPLIDGKRKHPMGRLGIEERGPLGKWGPNPASDAMITKETRDGKVQVLLARREDGTWAIPGAILGDDEDPAVGADRALREKVGISLAIQETDLFYRGLAGDKRDTDDAWMVTNFYHKHFTAEQWGEVEPKSGRGTIETEWVDISDPRVQNLYADHSIFVSKALKSKGLPSFEIGNKRVIERLEPTVLRDQVFLAGPALKDVDVRAEFKDMLSVLGITYVDPTLVGADWKAETHIPIEVKGLAESRIDSVDINNLKGAYISLIEAGAAAVGSILRNGQVCGIFFEEMTEQHAKEKFGEPLWKVVLRTRALVKTRLQEAARNLPVIKIYESEKQYNGRTGKEAFKDWLKREAEKMKENPTIYEGDHYAVLPPKKSLKKSVVIFGSSGKQWHQRAKDKMMAENINFYDTLIEGREFTQSDLEREQVEKNESGVALMVIDNELTPDGRLGGEGALAEMCWQFLHAAQTGQKLIIYVEQTDDRAMHSLRLAAKLHIEQLIKEFSSVVRGPDGKIKQFRGVAMFADSADHAITLAAKATKELT